MKNLLIIGASSGGRIIAEATKKEDSRYRLVGLLDADPATHGGTIAGARVLGNYDNLARVLEEHDVDEVIVAIADLDKEILYQFVDITSSCDVSLSIIPSTAEKNIHDELFNQLREVNAADLLGRSSVAIDEAFIAEKVSGKSILVTGAAGSIGSEIVRQLVRFEPREVIAIDINENDLYFLELFVRRYFEDVSFKTFVCNVREKDSLENAFQLKPDFIFHAAAHKHVPLMEHAPIEAIKNNVLGTLNVLEMTAQFPPEVFVLVSTDKAVNPTNVMGATKRLAEKLTAAFAGRPRTRYTSVRFGNVLGSNGSVVPIFKTLLEEGQDLTVTHPEATRFFMTIPEAARLVIEAACRAKGSDLFVLDMGEPVKIMDMANRLIRLSGVKVHRDIKVKITGLRPGEKLHEELFYDPGCVERIENPKIFKVRNDHHSSFALERLLDELTTGSYKKNPRAFLKSYVSEYQWNGTE